VAYPPLAHPTDAVERRFAEHTQRQIDSEVVRLLREAEEQASLLLKRHRAALDELTQRLLATETLDGKVVYDIARDTTSTNPQTGAA
jgi:cell division protease FtsH